MPAAEGVDVLLIQLLNWYREEDLRTDVYAPVGLGYVAAGLESSGYSVAVVPHRQNDADGRRRSRCASGGLG